MDKVIDFEPEAAGRTDRVRAWKQVLDEHVMGIEWRNAGEGLQALLRLRRVDSVEGAGREIVDPRRVHRQGDRGRLGLGLQERVAFRARIQGKVRHGAARRETAGAVT